MKSTPKTLKIVRVDYESGHVLKISFSDGKVKIIDFAPFIQNSVHPEIRKYLKPQNFRKFSIQNGDLLWGDYDLLFPIMDLYKNTINKVKLSAVKRVG